MSAFTTLDLARERWRDIAQVAEGRGEEVRVGYYVAEVRLVGGEGFSYEDLDEEDGHMTIWGDRIKLAEAVVDVHEARG